VKSRCTGVDDGDGDVRTAARDGDRLADGLGEAIGAGVGLALADGAESTCAAKGGRDRSPRPLPIRDSASAPTATAQPAPADQASTPTAVRPRVPCAAR
jgi:hypothetical protein